MRRRTEHTLPNKGKQKRYMQQYHYNNNGTCTVAFFDGDRLSQNLQEDFGPYAKHYPTVGYFYIEVPYEVVNDYLKTVGK